MIGLLICGQFACLTATQRSVLHVLKGCKAVVVLVKELGFVERKVAFLASSKNVATQLPSCSL